MTFVSVTRLRLRRWYFLPAFFYYASRSIRDAERTEGNLSVSTFRDRGLTFWTITLWQSESAMRSFRGSGAHRKVMPKLSTWCNEATYVHWQMESEEEPSHDEAYERLIADGTVSKVKFPSPFHLEKQFIRPD